MKYQLITIVSKLGDDVQAWTFDIEEKDLEHLMRKYDCCGVSILGDAETAADEIKEMYK